MSVATTTWTSTARQYNNDAEKTSYGQPFVFDVSGTGDPFAYLHKSLPGVIDGGAPLGRLARGHADQTSAPALLTFSAEGDLPLRGPSGLAGPRRLRQNVALTDDKLRAWNASWQAYYEGGAKPTMPLCPGTNRPRPRHHGRREPPAGGDAGSGRHHHGDQGDHDGADRRRPDQGRGNAAKKAKTSKKASCMQQGQGEEGQAKAKKQAMKRVPPALACGPH